MRSTPPLASAARPRRVQLAFLATALVLLFAVPAASITLTPTDRGWFRSDGLHTAGQNNTFTGTFGGNSYRSFYSFDVNNVGGNWSQATLNLTVDLYYNGDASETVQVFAVSSPAATVSAGHTIGSGSGLAVYNDLGSGVSYGTATVTNGNVGGTVSFVLNAAAIADINAARGGQWIFALVHTTGNGGNQGVRFGTNGTWDAGTTSGASVPEPFTGILLTVGILGLTRSARG